MIDLSFFVLYPGNLSWDTRADDLNSFFSKYGSVEDAFVATDRETGRSRGFGFVTLESTAAKIAASEVDGAEFMGRYAVCCLSTNFDIWSELSCSRAYHISMLSQDHQGERGCAPRPKRRR